MTHQAVEERDQHLSLPLRLGSPRDPPDARLHLQDTFWDSLFHEVAERLISDESVAAMFYDISRRSDLNPASSLGALLPSPRNCFFSLSTNGLKRLFFLDVDVNGCAAEKRQSRQGLGCRHGRNKEKGDCISLRLRLQGIFVQAYSMVVRDSTARVLSIQSTVVHG